MRVLMMISNNHMGLRELYTTVLDNHAAGWVASFMSGMPSNVETVISGYDAVIYELGSAESADRVAIVATLRQAGMRVVTHVEGREATRRTEELEAMGTLVVANPVTADGIERVLDILAASGRKGGKATKDKGSPEAGGLGGWFRRILGRQ